jgi:polysaccharide pyruvyl transferase WcaK-like protein
MEGPQTTFRRIAFFGHFDSTNFGNEATLQAILYHLKRLQPATEVICISSGPEATIATHHIKAIPITEVFFPSWKPRTKLTRILRKLFVGLPSEPYRWIKSVAQLKRVDALIVPGTGLLNDADGFSSRGPYNIFKWLLMAKLCGCKSIFVSVGGGPLYGTLSRQFVKGALSFADYRSYRDLSTMNYLGCIGFPSDRDAIYPDLAFSLPEVLIPSSDNSSQRRPVVGLGLMVYAGRYSISTASDAVYLAYLTNITIFAKWLLGRGYDIRLLSGDLMDARTRREFKNLLRKELPQLDDGRVVDEPIGSVEDVLSQIARTDLVVATRFHNVLLSFLCHKPAIAISFHHKCDSLMRAVEMSEYCLDINDLSAEKLVEKFSDLERNADKIKHVVGTKTKVFREKLDEQYRLIFDHL